MDRFNHFDFVPEGENRPLLMGYRKFIIAAVWLALAILCVFFVILGKPSAGQITFCLWVVGSAGFFCSIFVVGNAFEWNAFWKVSTSASLTQADKTDKIIYQDSQEDSAWKQAEQKLLSKK